jgi:hypothetical protein
MRRSLKAIGAVDTAKAVGFQAFDVSIRRMAYDWHEA